MFAVNPFIQKNLQYDPVKDFDPLTVAVRAPNVLVANPNYRASTVAELLALMKEPDKVTFATSGAGSSDHLTAALFWQKTGTNGVHVPYKGGAPAITDFLAGHVDVSFQNINAVISHIKAGKLKVLAVTGDKRSPQLPNVPTLGEAGVGRGCLLVAGHRRTKGAARRRQEEAARRHRRGTQRSGEPQADGRPGVQIVANTPEQMARLGTGTRPLEAGDRDRQDRAPVTIPRLPGRPSMNAQEHRAPVTGAPTVTAMRVIPVAGRDSMLLNLSGAHGPFSSPATSSC